VAIGKVFASNQLRAIDNVAGNQQLPKAKAALPTFAA
jgi:hypothetical protein